MPDHSPKPSTRQPTNLYKLPPAPTEKELAEPKGGWDKNWDMREATRICRNNRSAISKNVADDSILFQMAEGFYDLGIAEATAVRLVCRFCGTPRSKKNVAEIVGSAYRNKATFVPPGLRSLSRPPDDDDDETPEAVRALGWPVSINFDDRQHA
ncbi:MAG: hypothetical protein KDA71_23525, partial [Planctomycetales bacterium]|nr:hypothetical protein [Planctomycetales bacterium]